MFSEKGIVFIGGVDSDDDDDDVDTLGDICKGHGISLYTDPRNIRFEVLFPRIDEQSKRVVSVFMIPCFVTSQKNKVLM